MSDTTHCKKCGARIWWEESASRTCWMSRESGSWCVEETSHAPETGRMFTVEEVIEIANETSDSFGNLYRLDFIRRIQHEAAIEDMET